MVAGINPGVAQPKVVPGVPRTVEELKGRPTVTVPLLNDNNIPDVRACQGDVIVFCNLNSDRIYILIADRMKNLNSGILYPITHAGRRSGLQTEYRYYVADAPGSYFYRDERLGHVANITVMASAQRDPSWYEDRSNKNYTHTRQ
eukprot:CAMPEP_0168600754 /NCGR_PEP_ID=MMETSP0420-20121227/12992_1 /TAXON_ID=498008 /ORGANISM="Pessonella sp." /LENGTH=144 /DNA_ID=CAMNT_0008638945 /DNA_START=56 /DNA_END=491 /DNA_ORIENTATION=+